MATFTKFNTTTLNQGNGKVNYATDTLQVALCAAANAPVATNSVLTDLTQISYTNCSTRVVTTTSWTQTSGVAKLILADLVLTATGSVGPFRYIVLYSNTATNKDLIGYIDLGSDQTLDGTTLTTFTIDFDASAGVLTNT